VKTGSKKDDEREPPPAVPRLTREDWNTVGHDNAQIKSF
jgi:hypothetical protein